MKCQICGCTEEKACKGGCFWPVFGIPYCSKCIDKVKKTWTPANLKAFKACLKLNDQIVRIMTKTTELEGIAEELSAAEISLVEVTGTDYNNFEIWRYLKEGSKSKSKSEA